VAWPTLPDSIDLLATNWDNAYYERYYAQTSINAAQAHWNLGEDHEAINDLIIAVQYHNDCLDWMLTFSLPLSPTTLLPKILYQIYDIAGGEPFELTMAALINCMLTADNEEYKSFIGIVDAYRVALWNKPFEVEFYAALARGFIE